MTRKIDINFESEGLPTLMLKLKAHSRLYYFSFKLLAVVALIWSLLLLITETTLIFTSNEAVSYFCQLKPQNVWYTFTLTMVVMALIISTAFFTIFKLRFSDYL